MHRMLSLVVFIALALAGVAFGAEGDIARFALDLRNPVPYLVADTSFRVPQLPQPPPLNGERPAYGDIQAIYAVTNNVYTVVRAEYKAGTDARRMTVRLYIDSDGNARTGSGVGYYTGQTPVDDFGFDYEIQAGWNYIAVRAADASCCLSGYAEVIDSTSNSLTIKISNRLFSEEGRVQKMRFQATLIDNQTGSNLSIAPEKGTALVPSTTMITLSPASGTKLYKIGQEDTKFNLVADITTIVPEQQVTLFVSVNGNNLTPLFVSNTRTGLKALNQTRGGGPNYFTFTKRFVYPIESIVRGGGKDKVVFSVLTNEGVAYDEVTYTAEEIVESAP